MKQFEIIQSMKENVFPKSTGLNAALLIGSCAKGTLTSKSDIDISLWIDKEVFDMGKFISLLKESISGIEKILPIAMRGKIAVYFSDCPKMELLIFSTIDGLDKHFLGSEIENRQENILFSRDGLTKEKLLSHLSKILLQKEEKAPYEKERIVRELADRFIYEFENASSKHKRSDNYKFYFDYNIALQIAVQLSYIARGSMAHYYLPKNFSSSMSNEKKEEFISLAGSLDLQEANKKKRLLLDFFYEAIQNCNIHSKAETDDMKEFIESVYSRDYIWNFRDISLFCKHCKSGLVFRSSSFTRYQHDKSVFESVIKQYKINSIVDLRENKELEKNSYDKEILESHGIRYLNLAIDTKRPLINFADNLRLDMEKEYRWFAVGNRDFFKKFFTQINPEKDITMIHCFAGKDRTGCVCALIELLAGESKNTVETDYLESEMDSNIRHIRAFVDAIYESGGSEKFLLSCGVPAETINFWKKTIKREGRNE